MKVKAHLHLPRLKRGVDEVISVAPFAHIKGVPTEYYGTVALTGVSFKVSQPGRKRTLEKKQRNVHAWVVGNVLQAESYQTSVKPGMWREAYYNPYKTETFVDKETGQPLTTARAALLTGAKVYYLPG